MARVLGLLLLVAAALVFESRASPFLGDFCPDTALTSCDGLNCTCNSNDMLYAEGEVVNCSACQDNVTYRVEFTPFSGSSCYDYFNATNIDDWQFRALSHPPSCTVTSNDTCCNQSQILDYFTTTGLDTSGELNVTWGYPYASVLAYLPVTNDNATEVALRLSVDRLRLCNNGSGWQQSVQTCGVYLYPDGMPSACIGNCNSSNYAAGCFNFTLTYEPDCPTDPLPTNMTTSEPTSNDGTMGTDGSMEANATTAATETSAGSVATPHNLPGLVALALVVVQFLHAIVPN